MFSRLLRVFSPRGRLCCWPLKLKVSPSLSQRRPPSSRSRRIPSPSSPPPPLLPRDLPSPLPPPPPPSPLPPPPPAPPVRPSSSKRSRLCADFSFAAANSSFAFSSMPIFLAADAASAGSMPTRPSITCCTHVSPLVPFRTSISRGPGLSKAAIFLPSRATSSKMLLILASRSSRMKAGFSLSWPLATSLSHNACANSPELQEGSKDMLGSVAHYRAKSLSNNLPTIK
mmetsp:Transcript_46763/g.111216  ORF Transcript_46763/g.111216 Transcript_46763/m.111216 type:complete len:228 (-) Transcript_46763:34-717(-)